MANSCHIIDADFEVVVGLTTDAVELEAETVERESVAARAPYPVRAPVFTTMVFQQIWRDRRDVYVRQLQRANAKRLKRWAIAFAAAVLLYGLSGSFGVEQIP